MKELGIEKPIIGGPILVSEGTYLKSEGLLPDNAFTVTIYVDINDPKIQPFVNHMMDNYGGYGFTLFYIAGVYDNVFLLKEAIEACGEVDSTCMDEYMNNLQEFNGITGKYRFDKGRNPMVTLATKYIKEGKEVNAPA